MKLVSPLTVPALLTLAVSLLSPMAQAYEALQVDDKVMATLNTLPKPATANATINTSAATTYVFSGMGAPSDVYGLHKRSNNNIWSSVTISQGKGYGMEEASLSLCGLITLTSASTSNIEGSLTLPVLINKYFSVGYKLKRSQDMATASQIKKLTLQSEAAELCAPVPGHDIVLSLEFEQTLPKPGLFNDSTSTTLTSESWRCSVAAAKPLSDLVPNAGGNYLPVSCTTKRSLPEELTTTANAAFLPGSGYYLWLGSKNDKLQMQQTFRTLSAGKD